MSKFKILLVDDEADCRETMALIIKEWGYEVIEASCGREAIDIVMNNNPDIIILDYMMPDMDGVATLTEIRKINKKIAVIMFTAYPDMKSIKAAKDLNVSVYTPKLSSYEDLRANLETAIHSLEENA